MKPRFTPLYIIDHAALASLPLPLLAVEFLVDFTADPHFRLSRVCRHCESWDRGNKSRLEEKPISIGRMDRTQGCDGCWFSFLDPVSDLAEENDPGLVEQKIATIEAALDRMDNERAIAAAKARVLELRLCQERYHAADQKRTEDRELARKEQREERKRQREEAKETQGPVTEIETATLLRAARPAPMPIRGLQQ